MGRLPALAAGAVLLGAAPACVTLGRFEQLEARVSEMELERQKLRAELEAGVTRLENLHGMLKQAEETLRSSGANLGLRTEQLEATVPKLLGKLEEAGHLLATAVRDLDIVKRELFDRLGVVTVFLPKDVPKTAEEVWTLAQKELKKEDTRVARALLDYFEASFPEDERADDALMTLGRLAEGEGDQVGAIKVYQRVSERYPKGDQAVKAMYRIGDLFVERGDCKRAKGVYELMARTWPDSGDGRAAKEKAKALARDCK